MSAVANWPYIPLVRSIVLTAWTLRVTGISGTGLRGGLMIVATPV
jgi:hypothetical protein